MKRLKIWLLAALTLSLLGGCAVNPVTGERELSIYDERWELATGEQYYAPLRQQQGGDFVLDPDLVGYVQEVGQRVAAHAPRTLPYEFAVINSSVPNAWALPGGKVSINRGLLTTMRTEAELAAVLGHEVAHAAVRHSAQQQSRSALTQGAVLLGGIAVGVATEREDYATIAVLGGMLGAQLVGQRYSRDAEREADLWGTRWIHPGLVFVSPALTGARREQPAAGRSTGSTRRNRGRALPAENCPDQGA